MPEIIAPYEIQLVESVGQPATNCLTCNLQLLPSSPPGRCFVIESPSHQADVPLCASCVLTHRNRHFAPFVILLCNQEVLLAHPIPKQLRIDRAMQQITTLNSVSGIDLDDPLTRQAHLASLPPPPPPPLPSTISPPATGTTAQRPHQALPPTVSTRDRRPPRPSRESYVSAGADSRTRLTEFDSVLPVSRPRPPQRRRPQLMRETGPTKHRVPLYRWISFTFDRPTLTALVDRRRIGLNCMFIAVLTFFTAFLACRIAHFYFDIALVDLWFIVACAQFSLIKTVVSDPSSSIIEDRQIAYSRALYFCISCVFAIIFDAAATNAQTQEIRFFNIPTNSATLLHYCRNIVLGFILVLPAVYLFGHLPRYATMLHWLLEQTDVHVFGGSGSVDLLTISHTILRNAILALLLWLLCWGSMVITGTSDDPGRNPLFSLFVGLLIGVAYVLSRLPTDISIVQEAVFWWIKPSRSIAAESTPVPAAESGAPAVVSSDLPNPNSGDAPNTATETGDTASGEEATADIEATESDTVGEADTTLPESAIKSELDKGIAVMTKLSANRDESRTVAALDARETRDRNQLRVRILWDLVIAASYAFVIFVIHLSSVFSKAAPAVGDVFAAIAITLGIVRTVVVHQLRKPYPFTMLRFPVLTSIADSLSGSPAMTAFPLVERLTWISACIERSFLWPVLSACLITEAARPLSHKFGPLLAALLLVVSGLKMARLGFYAPKHLSYALALALVFFKTDYHSASETTPVNLFFFLIFVVKAQELYQKVEFVLTYNSLWNFKETRASGFHVLLFPLTFAHSSMLFVQCIVGAIFSTAVYPVVGSSLFLVSYLRPLRFWERDYKTKHVTKIAGESTSKYDSSRGANNLNGTFYKHMLIQLQDTLANDIERGRWGAVASGDIFILIDPDNSMTCFVHIVEAGNGYCTFQMRGLEFAGTYCQSREIEALREDLRKEDTNLGRAGKLFKRMGLLNAGTIFTNYWRTWEHQSDKFVIPGYSVVRTYASALFQVHEFKRRFMKYMAQSVIFLTLESPLLNEWMAHPIIRDRLARINHQTVEKHITFTNSIDIEFAHGKGGLLFSRFEAVHGAWIRHRIAARGDRAAHSELELTRVCFAMWVTARRFFLHPKTNEAFLQSLFLLFEGDATYRDPSDSWLDELPAVFRTVIFPASRMALKLHKDSFADEQQFDDLDELAQSIDEFRGAGPLSTVVCSERDPEWQEGVFSNRPSLMSLRFNLDDSSDNQAFFLVSLTKAHRDLRVVRVNQEAVRGLWAAQQQEVLFFRNPNRERGSIQNCACVIRNLVGQSCDQPLGYPIFVSDLVHSYASRLHASVDPFEAARRGLSRVRNWVVSIARDLWENIGRGTSIPIEDPPVRLAPTIATSRLDIELQSLGSDDVERSGEEGISRRPGSDLDIAAETSVA